MNIQRIVVIGTSGSGKTTLAKALSQKLGLPHVELDALHWEPDWIEASQEETRRRAEAALPVDGAWIVDGNYSYTRDITWPRAQMIVWLDYPFFVVMARMVRRTLRRVWKKEVLWSGNQERWHMLFKRDSMILWVLKTHRRNARQYPLIVQQPEYEHLRIVRLCSQRETDEWLKTIKPPR